MKHNITRGLLVAGALVAAVAAARAIAVRR